MDFGLSQEPPSNTSIGGKGVSVKRRQAAPSLYFLCNYCDIAVVSVPKIKDHILKKETLHRGRQTITRQVFRKCTVSKVIVKNLVLPVRSCAYYATILTYQKMT